MIIVTTHKNTDFDGLASVIAGLLLYPDAVGVVPKMVNANVDKFLSTHKTAFNIVLPDEVDHNAVKTLVVVDTNQWKRLDRLENLRQRDDLNIHLWDHHEQQGDIEATWSCSENTGATITLMVREMKRRKMTLTPLHSTVLLIGLYEDTGSLSYPATRPEDAETAAYLLANGADLHVASFFLNQPYEEKQKDILLTVIQNTKKFTHQRLTVGISIVKLTQKTPMLGAILNTYRKLINAQAVFAIFINDESCSTVIGRSATDRIDAGAILARLGGGGHPGAASATVRTEDFSPSAIQEKIIELIEEDKTKSAVIADLMSYPVTMVSNDTPMNKVRRLMEERKIRGVLIGSEDRLEGIIVLWDFKKIKQDRQWLSPVKAFMKRNVQTIRPDLDPAEAAQIMVTKNIGHLPVEHEGKIIGIVTRTDILTFFYNMLPQ